MTYDILEGSVPSNWNGSQPSPRNQNPVIRRSRMNSNGSENSNGSAKSHDSRSANPSIKFIPVSAPASRAGSFRERPQSRSHHSSSSRNSTNIEKGGNTGSVTFASKNHFSSRKTESNGENESLGPRRNSMPNVSANFLKVPLSEDKDSRLRRVRSFKTTSKGAVVNRGDSFKKKSTHSLMSTGSTITEPRTQQQNIQQQQPQHIIFKHNSFLIEPPAVPTYFRVVLMGAAGCGKSLMTKQFMTSDFVGGFEDNQDQHERSVTVLLDGEESTIEFIDPPSRNVIVDGLQQLLDAYVVVFAINDHSSFEQAQELIRYLRVDYGTDRVIVLVANKIDLVRKRKVSADEARLVAETYDCKYTEISAALNHFVDELLVGILTQIRLHMSIPFTTISFPGKGSKSDDRKERRKVLKGPRGFFSRLFKRSSRKKLKPCENLHTL
uniref:Small monomeric GTPase n=2 Tax=Arion vulgaris TaxID=1028688 RepID=A0A0B6Z5E0_9EUPU